jgi:transcriptional regulator with XRE-family HTH domain
MRLRRVALGLTAADAARLVGCRPEAVSAVERGRLRPREERLRDLLEDLYAYLEGRAAR